MLLYWATSIAPSEVVLDSRPVGLLLNGREMDDVYAVVYLRKQLKVRHARLIKATVRVDGQDRDGVVDAADRVEETCMRH